MEHFLSHLSYLLSLYSTNRHATTLDFWRPIGYIPNLSYAKGVADRRLTKDKIQDKHTCISCTLQLLCNISNEGGFDLVVLGHDVRVKVWIHFITGDTSGHNNLVGHMNGSNMKYPYHDCKCELHELSESRPKCKLVTLDEIRNAFKNNIKHLKFIMLNIFLILFVYNLPATQYLFLNILIKSTSFIIGFLTIFYFIKPSDEISKIINNFAEKLNINFLKRF